MHFRKSRRSASIRKDVGSPGGLVSTFELAMLGYACRLPGAPTHEAFWNVLFEGRSTVTDAPRDRWQVERFLHPRRNEAGFSYSFAGGYLERPFDFDPMAFGISPREAEQIDPQQRLLLEVVWEALEDAGLPPSTLTGQSVGVYVGASNVDYQSAVSTDPAAIESHFMTGNSLSIVSNRISYIFDWRGPSFTVDSACSSSFVALGQAMAAIEAGVIDTAVVAGVNLLLSPAPFIGFSRASMLSPTGRSRPFSADGDGYVRSEGAVAIVLRRLSAARSAGNRVRSVIAASGTNSDGRTSGISLPSVEGQRRLLEATYSKLGIDADQLAFIEAHGTGTPVGDPVEATAIGEALGRRRAATLPIGSVKSNIGHLECVSGLAGLLKSSLALEKRVYPKSLYVERTNPNIPFSDLNLAVVRDHMPLDGSTSHAGICNYGFGGTNSHVILRRATPEESAGWRSASGADQRARLLLLSARTRDGLAALAGAYADRIEQDPDDLSAIAAAAAFDRDQFEHRLAVPVSHPDDVVERLRTVAASGQIAGRVATGSGTPQPARVAFVYSGNGAQWAGMGRFAFARSAPFRQRVREIDSLFKPLGGWSLVEALHDSALQQRLGKTSVAQPLLFCIQSSLTGALAEHGITPEFVLGHSIGEVAAAQASGALSLKDAVHLIHRRSLRQESFAGLGQMAAMNIGGEEAKAFLAEFRFRDVEIAAFNSPGSVTLSGSNEAIAMVIESAKHKRIATIALGLPYPFHSRFLESARDAIVDDLQVLKPQRGTIPFISSVSGMETKGRALDATYWWRNIRKSVRFSDAVRRASELGANLFVEISARPILISAVSETLRASDATANVIGTLSERDDQGGDDPVLASAGRIIVQGAGFSRQKLYGDPPVRRVELPHYQWQRQRYTLPLTSERFDPFGGAFGDPPAHPLLGRRIGNGGPEWRNLIDGTVVPYLADHRVDGELVMPAAAFVEMAVALGQIMLGQPLRLSDFDILRPMTISADSMREISTRYDETTSTVEIWSRRRFAEGDWSLHARGQLSRPDAEAGLDRVQPNPAVCRTVSGDDVYQAARLVGLEYGPAFQRIVSLKTDGVAAEVLLSPPHAPMHAGGEKELLHPVSLDAALHSLFAEHEHNKNEKRAFLPVRFHSVTLWRPGTIVVGALVARSRDTKTTKRINIWLLAADGTVVAEVDGAVLRSVVLSQRDDGQRCFRIETEPLLPAHEDSVVVPVPSEPTVRRQPPVADGWLLVQALMRSFVHETVRGMAGRGKISVSDLVRTGKLHESAASRMNDLLAFLASHDLAVGAGQDYRLQGRPAPPASDILFRTLVAHFPAASAEIRAVASVMARLRDELRQGTNEGPPDAVRHPFEENGIAFREGLQNLGAAIDAAVTRAQPAKAHVVVLAPWTAGLIDLLLGKARDGAIRVTLAGRDRSAFDLLAARHQPGIFGFADMNAANDDAFRRTDLVLAFGISPVLEHVIARDLQKFSRRLAGSAFCFVAMKADPVFDILLGDLAAWHGVSRTEAGPAGNFLAADEMFRSIEGVRIEPPAREAASSEFCVTLHGRIAPALPSSANATDIGICADGDAAFAGMLFDAATRQKHLTVRSAESGEWPGREVAEGHLLLPLRPGPEPTASTRLAAMILKIRRVLEAVRANGRPVPLWLLLCGAWQAPETGVEPVAAAVAAFARVAINEYPDIDLRIVDVASFDEGAATQVLALIAAGSREREIALRGRSRYGLRVRRGRATDIVPASAGIALQLDVRQPGRLASAAWIAADRPDPAEDEVEVEISVTGLNFRDVMIGLGVLDDDIVGNGLTGASLGFEFSGRVSRTGPGAKVFSVGDRVMGFGPHAFRSHISVPGWCLFPVPDTVELEAAATIPVAFATAWHGLVECARLRRGETVLVHGAAGGVGLAAIQIAHLLGAKVLATAGTADKAAMLRALGVEAVYGSRGLAFEDSIAAEHGGVDVVLNSLAGDAMAASLRLLKPFGRFVELGKRDYLANTTIGLRPFARNLSYFGVDLDQLLAHDRAVVARTMKALLRELRRGRLRPLPYQLFAGEDVPEAFRLMQGAGHIGKIVVAPGTSGEMIRSAPSFVPGEGVHLVVGGTQGFGFETAKWLLAKGAVTVVVASRSGVSDPARLEEMARLSQGGRRIVAEKLDVRDPVATEAFLSALAERYGPIRGVFHTAMVLEDGLIQGLTEQQLRAVLEPKVEGIAALDRATASLPLDYFVAYSSAAALIGSPGQGAYVAANAYIEAVIRERRRRGLPGLAVAWGAISDAGVLAQNQGLSRRLQRSTGVSGIASTDALAFLDEAMAAGDTAPPVQVYSEIRHSALARKLAILRTPVFSDVFAADDSEAEIEHPDAPESFEGKSEAEIVELLIPLLAAEIGKILRLPASTIDPRRSLVDLGMDSLMALELRLSVEQRFGVELPLVGIGDGRTLADLVKSLAGALGGNVEPTTDLPEPILLSPAEEALIARHGIDVNEAGFGRLVSAVERNRKAAG